MTKNKKAPRVVIQRGKKKTSGKKKSSEVTRLGAALRALGGLGGGMVGNLVGRADYGSSLGTGIGAAVSRWLGSGDYRVSSNSVVQRVLRGSDSVPSMHKSGQSISVQHREYLGEIKGSVAFSVQRFFTIQPGDVNTFPWLHTIAAQFQQYRIKGMVVHYVPTSGEVVSGTNPAIGSVMIQTSYRATESAPATKVEMLNEYWASESKPSLEFCHPIECSPKENPFEVHYVRTRPVPTNDSALLYDLGNIFVATSGMPGANVIGDLWVTYDIELMKPQVLSDVAANVSFTSIRNVGGATSNLFGTGVLTTGFGGVTFSTNTVTFPYGTVGTFLVVLDIVASTFFTAYSSSGPAITGATAVALTPGIIAYRSQTGGASVLNEGVSAYAFKITDPSVQATLNFASSFTVTGAIAEVDCTITQMV